MKKPRYLVEQIVAILKHVRRQMVWDIFDI
jgi:hypothetical protein